MTDSTNPLVAMFAETSNSTTPVGELSTTLQRSDGSEITVLVPSSEICSVGYFRRVVAAAFTAYSVSRVIPDIRAIAKYMGTKPSAAKISKVVATEEYKQAMFARGINVRKNKGILPEQSYALEIITDPSRKNQDLGKKLASAGVSYTQWRSWLKDPLFSKAFNTITENMLSEHQGDVHVALVNRAISGDMRAIEYFNQVTGRFDPNRTQVLNLQSIISGLLEIITREVTDQPTLIRLSDGIDRLLNKENVPAISASPADVMDAEVIENSPFAFEFERQT